MGAEQKALQVRQSDVNPGEETVRRLVLGGDSRGGVFKAFLLQAAITAPAVGENMAPCCDFGGEEFLHRCGGGIRNHFQSGKSRNGLLSRLAGPTTLHRHGHHGFAPHAGLAAPAPPFPMLLTAHIALVDLHQAAEPIALIAVTHRLANLVQHQPGGRIADPNFLGQLHRRDPLLVVTHAVDRPEPTRQRRPGFVKNRPRRHRTLIAACAALMHLPNRHVSSARTAAAWTTKAIRPPLPAQLLPTLLLLTERCPKLLHRQHLATFPFGSFLH